MVDFDGIAKSFDYLSEMLNQQSWHVRNDTSNERAKHHHLIVATDFEKALQFSFVIGENSPG